MVTPSSKQKTAATKAQQEIAGFNNDVFI